MRALAVRLLSQDLRCGFCAAEILWTAGKPQCSSCPEPITQIALGYDPGGTLEDAAAAMQCEFPDLEFIGLVEMDSLEEPFTRPVQLWPPPRAVT